MSRIRELENFSKLANTELLRIRETFLQGKNLLLILINSLSRGIFSNSLIKSMKLSRLRRALGPRGAPYKEKSFKSIQIKQAYFERFEKICEISVTK
jgi:hypothetical protein